MLEPIWLNTLEIDDASSDPGLYAWYCVPIAGEGVIKARLEDSVDAAVSDFGDFLSGHTTRIRQPQFEVEAKGHLWAHWSGRLSESGSDRLGRQIERLAADETSGPGSKLGWAMKTEDRRRALASVLVECAPRLASPIYIGVATSLRTRLKTHRNDFRDTLEVMQAGRVGNDDHKNKFGVRAARLGITEDELRVGILPLPQLDDSLDPDALRDVAEAAEFVLNRWHHPLLGIQ